MKKKEINFSIIVPVYNVEQYVEKSLNSIFAAVQEDCEIIIIDDGSKDDSKKIVEEYISKIHNKTIKNQTKLIHLEKNTGLSNVKNVGIQNAIGKFISFVDSDDRINENFYNEARKYIEDYDVIVYDIYADYENSPRFNHIIHVAREDVEGTEREKLIHGAMQGSSCNKIIRKNLYKYKFPVGKEYEDVAVTPFILVDAKKIKYISNPYYIYLQRKTSIVGNSKWDEAYYKICENINNTFLIIKKENIMNYMEIIKEFYFYRIIDSFDFSLIKRKRQIKYIIKDFINKNEFTISIINNYLNNGGNLPDILTKNQKRLQYKIFKYLNLAEYKKCIKLLKMRRWLNYFRKIIVSGKDLIKAIFKGVYHE